MTSTRNGSSDPDVVVVGGGPAGSTTSTLIAQQGYKVQLFERERFPRFHIGESLIPETYWVLKRLGMLPKMQKSHFVKKYSVQFVNANGKLSAPFYFWDNKPHECSQTWQVVRSEFDKLMLDNAREHGVEVHEGMRVLDVLMEDGRARGRPGEGRGRGRARGAREGGGGRERPGRAAAEPPAPARLGPRAQQGRHLDLLGRAPTATPAKDEGATMVIQTPSTQRLVLVHPAPRRHRERGRRRALRLPLQGARPVRADLRGGGRGLPGGARSASRRRSA